MAKAHIYFFGGGTPHGNSANWEVGTPHIPSKWGEQLGWEKTYIGMGGGHRTYFFDGGNNWGGDTAQH